MDGAPAMDGVLVVYQWEAARDAEGVFLRISTFILQNAFRLTIFLYKSSAGPTGRITWGSFARSALSSKSR